MPACRTCPKAGSQENGAHLRTRSVAQAHRNLAAVWYVSQTLLLSVSGDIRAVAKPGVTCNLKAHSSVRAGPLKQATATHHWAGSAFPVPPLLTSVPMNQADVEKLDSLDGIHFLHNLPSAHVPHEEAGIIRRKAYNAYRKAVHAGKWRNFAAGIGTGAAYASLHGLHWHPRWITIIECVRLLLAAIYLVLTYHPGSPSFS